MSNLKIDTLARKLSFLLNLKSETAPIGCEVTYRIVQSGLSATLVFDSIKISREWIDRLVQEFLPNEIRRIKLEGKAKAILDLLV